MDTQTGGSRLLAGGDALLADNLFLFGDRDGPTRNSLLQHPLAVASAPDGVLYIADSYNHKVKRYDPVSGVITTVAGTTSAAFRDGLTGLSALSEPGGLVIAPDGGLLIADTNNNVIRRLDVVTGNLSTLPMIDVPAPNSSQFSPPAGRVSDLAPPGAKLVVTELVRARSARVDLVLSLPEGFHFTPGAPSSWTAAQISGPPGLVRLMPMSGALADAPGAPAMSLSFETTGSDGAEGIVRILARIYFCQDNDVCLLEELAVAIPFQVSDSRDAETLTVQHSIQASAPKVNFPAL